MTSHIASREARRIVTEVLREHATAGCPHAAAELEHRRRRQLDAMAEAGVLVGAQLRRTVDQLVAAVRPVYAYYEGVARAAAREGHR